MINIIVAPRDYNPTAERITKKIVKYIKSEQVEYSVYFSQTFENLKDNVKQLLSFGENELVVVGDDVVISSVISSVKDLNKIKLGIVPTSSNDDFAKGVGISLNPVQAMKDILKKHIENIDLLVVNDMPVINNVIIGANVDVFYQFNQFKIKNFISQKFAEMKYGKNFGGIDLILEAKNKQKKENVFELIVANGGYAKGKMISPLSNMQDGLFNVSYTTLAHKTSKKRYLKKVKNGEHIYDDQTKQHWMSNLKITNPEKKIKVLIDGKVQNVEELTISIIEKGLKIYKRP